MQTRERDSGIQLAELVAAFSLAIDLDRLFAMQHGLLDALEPLDL